MTVNRANFACASVFNDLPYESLDFPPMVVLNSLLFNKVEGNPYLSSVEELYYYRLFKKTFPHSCFDRLVGRWDPLRPDFFRNIEKAAKN